jgi:outer membrane receptor for ferrienterochelin and colicin
MFAAEPPAAVAPADAVEQQDVIEIVGKRADETLKIDRRTYEVRQTPHSEQKDALQLLRGLPAVTVSPDEEISLLGSSNVRIFVDGRPYQGDTTQFLRTLHGSDVERIEVITNPSAQYASEGTSGIINFVLRKKRDDGTSGMVSGELSTPSNTRADATLKSKHGKWTYELSGALDRNVRRTHYRKRRSVEEAVGGPATVNTEDGGGPSRDAGGYASGKLTYGLDEKTNVSAQVQGVAYRSRSINSARFDGVTPDFQSFTTRQRYHSSGAWAFGKLALDHKGAKEGETLTASLEVGKNWRQRETNHSSVSNGGALFTQRLKTFSDANAKADWQHPMGKGQILSLGGIWDRSRMSEDYRFESSGTGLIGFTAADRFSGIEDMLAGYATFQQPVGDWTVMPGIRVERDSRRISSPGHLDVRIAAADLFPTLHVNRKLGERLDLTLSYSKRIDRPQLNELRPYAIVQDVVTVKQGNPHLENQSTDAYEINLHYHHKTMDAGLILYDRETSRLWSPSYSVIDGINVFTWINSGHRRDTGAEFDVAMPILSRVKLNAAVNLFYRRVPVGDVNARESEATFRYTTDTTLQWTAPDRGKVPGDVAQVQWRHYSPSLQFQLEDFARDGVTVSYTHSFSKSVSLSATADYWAPFGHRLEAPLVQELYRERSPARFKVKLLKTFGSR